jgi:hypothetical protein
MANELSSPSKRVADFLEKVKSKRGRIIFILDATGSRKEAWDLASRTQAEMFSEAATLGTLDVQLVYFKGIENYGGECKAGPWTNDANVLARLMSRIRCDTGHTQIKKALDHVRKMHQEEPVNAVIFIGDMCEENKQTLYDATASLSGVPLFMFQEGHDRNVEEIFHEMARLSRGAYFAFRPGAADQLRDLLRAVAAFSVGGLTALSDMKSEAAVKLLGQLK